LTSPNPRRGEIWQVQLDPTVGSEIQKTRPVVIVSSDAIRALPLRLVAPITEWKEHFQNQYWKVRIEPNQKNGLSKTSAVDALQLRGVDLQRFVKLIGCVDADTMDEIVAAIELVVESTR